MTTQIVFTVANDSMEPRYFAGETVIAEIGAATLPGEFVVVTIDSGDGLIGRLASIDDGGVVIEQLTPQQATQIERDQITAIHKIIFAGNIEGIEA